MTQKPFRQDINGLRAWAVVAVILYHFGIAGFSGGFIGVDVFFVISGFLMTGIIVTSLENNSAMGGAEGKFSLAAFYGSRARRIIPALLALCAVLLIAGWFLLSPLDYRALGTHTISALGFFSNIKFWREAGYFDTASHEKLLLHTWSLSVEAQFYLLFPLALLAIWKLRPGRKAATFLIAAGFLLSLLLSILVSPTRPSAAFYLLPTRAWELLAGSLVWLLAARLRLSPPVQKGVEGTGFALIIAAILLFDAGSSWPGWRALVPVLGTVLVLVAARQNSLWTSSGIAQGLGNYSYSLYLWHWPFAVALIHLDLRGHPAAIALGLILTAVFAALSYRLIETPARFSLGRMPRLRSIGIVLTLLVGVATLGLFIRTQQGFPQRLPPYVQAVFTEAENKNPRMAECHVSGRTPVPECTYGGDNLGIIVIGDSHAASVMRSVEKALPDQDLHVLHWSLSACPTISGIKHVSDMDYRCDAFVDYTLDKARALPNAPLIIVNRTSFYIFGVNEHEPGEKPDHYLSSPYASYSAAYLQEMRNGIIETACAFSETRPVYMLRPIPELKVDVPNAMGRALMQGRAREVSISLEEYHQRHAFVWEAQDTAAERCGVKILDPLPYLCRDGRCLGAVDGLPIYYDDDHLNERGGNLLIPLFRQIFEADPQGTGASRP